jgi:hypothetical protein
MLSCGFVGGCEK